jgi:hypothetical protein
VLRARAQSFLYLKHFYLGELRPEDRAQVPQAEPPPSPEFLAQLRDYTAFRLPVATTYKSF